MDFATELDDGGALDVGKNEEVDGMRDVGIVALTLAD